MRIAILFWIVATSFSHVIAQPELSVTVPIDPIVIDGQLSPNEWNLSDSIDTFFQIEPTRGASASRRTVIYVNQYGGDLFFGVVCYVKDKSEIVARIQRRDMVNDSDDAIAIILDTYDDHRTSLLFLVNAIGTMGDAKVTDDGKNTDFFWDTEWEAEAKQYDNKWVLEIRIPYRSLQYNPKSPKWGANFGRVIRANQETSWWSPVTENFRVSQGGVLNNIDPKGLSQHNLALFPYGTLRYEDSDVTEVYEEVNGDAGLDVLYNFGPNLISNLTFNPDFATVEADQEIINLSPWELRFPDKRLFFQDGNEMFRTRISTFYSRRIGDMKYGGKIIGKSGKYQFNGLFARTESNPESNDPEGWHNAVRIKRDILNSSILGLTYADKINDSLYVRSLSLDYVLNLGKTWKLTGQFVGSAPGDFASHSAWFLRFARENNIYHYHVRYSNIGRNFQENVNQTGFIPDDDRHEVDGDISYTWWINKKIKYFSVEGRNNVFWSQSGILRSWNFTYGGRIYLSNRFSGDIAINNEYKLLDKDYNNHFFRAEVGYNTDEASFGNIGYQFGRNFDRDFQLWQGDLRLQVLKKLTLNYELTVLTFNPDPTGAGTTINVLGADYFFTKDLWIRVFTQNNSANDKFYFYGLFGWRFKPPFGALYFIVSSDRYEEQIVPAPPELIRSEIVFLKLTYPLVVL